jgi:hypothetical protein
MTKIGNDGIMTKNAPTTFNEQSDSEMAHISNLEATKYQNI